MDNLFDQIPGLREAVEKETEQRELDFLGAPILICGVEVLPLTIVRFLRLQAVGSPFVVRSLQPVNEVDVAHFLWCVSPVYELAFQIKGWLECFSTWLAGKLFSRMRKAFARRVRSIRFDNACESIREYLDDAFADSPGSSGGSELSPYGWPARYVGLLASEYGWTESEILNLPTRRLMQHVRRIIKSNDKDAIFFNRSDRVRGDWLREQNARQHDR